jgi:hypothetical protein
MTNRVRDPELEPVAAVCGNEVRYYDMKNKQTGIRAFMGVKQFPHRGAALMAADEFNNPPSVKRAHA